MGKVLFLTIDDFPSKTSEQMLSFLSEKEIPCILFCIGKELAQQEALAVEALSMGFTLGNHSYTHKAFSKISLKEAYREIEKTHRVLENIYRQAARAWKKKYFRFPYGDKGDGTLGQVFTRAEDARKRLNKKRIQKRLSDLGYTNLVTPGVSYSYYQNFLAKERDCHWTLDTMEWCLKRTNGMFELKNEDDVLARLFSGNPFDCRGQVPEQNYGLIYPASAEVILMHDCAQTFPSFKKIINALMENGNSFARFT